MKTKQDEFLDNLGMWDAMQAVSELQRFIPQEKLNNFFALQDKLSAVYGKILTLSEKLNEENTPA